MAFQRDAFQTDAFQVERLIFASGVSDGAAGVTNVQGFNGAGVVLEPVGVYLDAGFGTDGSVRNFTGVSGSPQTLTVPYFTDTSVPMPLHVAAKIGCTGFTNQSFGDLTHRTWIFTAGDQTHFGEMTVGVSNIVLVESDSSFPAFNSMVYAFGSTVPPKIFCFGLTAKWGAMRVSGMVTPVGMSAGFGMVGANNVTSTLIVSGTRFPSMHTTVKFPFGLSPFVESDTFVATEFGAARVAGVVNAVVIQTGQVGEPMVTRFNPPALRLRDAKNTTLKFDAVPFQFGFPKRDIFAVGLKPSGVGSSNVRGSNMIMPTGYVATAFWHWYWPEFQQFHTQNIEWPLSAGYAITVSAYGATVVNNTGQHGIRPAGAWLGNVASTLSVTNVRKSIHPYHGRTSPLGNVIDNVHTRFGSPSAAIRAGFIPAQYVRPQPFTEVFRTDDWVWPVETRYVGPAGLGRTEAGAFVQVVVLDPDFYAMEGFLDDWYGEVSVEHRSNIHVSGLDTLWGASEVTHYTRSVLPWQPWKDTRIGEIKFKRAMHAAGIPTAATFGDVHQWHENTIQLRPWDMSELGIPRTVAVVAPLGSTGYVPSPRMAEPIYAAAFDNHDMNIPTVVYGDASYCCGQIPRALVPKEFAKTQFGDFDASL